MSLIFIVIQLAVDFLFVSLFLNNIQLFDEIHDMLLDLRSQLLEKEKDAEEF